MPNARIKSNVAENPFPSRAQLRQYLQRESQKRIGPVVAEHVANFRHVVRGWSDETKPQFDPRVRFDGTTLVVWIQLDAPDAYGSDTKSVFELLSEGTKERYAHMEWPYQAMTQPGAMRYETKSRIGKMNYVDGNAPPLPGIEARGWIEDTTEKMAEEIDPIIEDIVKEAFSL